MILPSTAAPSGHCARSGWTCLRRGSGARRRLPNVVERRRRRPRLPWEGAISGSAHSRGVDCVMALQAPQQRLLVLLLRSPQG